jgi:hypothetical protein
MAKQQRWLTRNSLLSESVIPNSFLITQAKKLIGQSTLNKDFTSKTLWLPTKSSKLSSIESSIYFNNINNQLFSTQRNDFFLKNNQLLQNNFDSINFFENSRLWLFKKYFFTNSQNQNLIVNTPKNFSNFYKNYIPSIDNIGVSQINFYSNTYLTSLYPIIYNNMTPSLHLHKNSNINFLDKNLNRETLLKTHIGMVTPQLDLLNGVNNNFLFILTSNPQNLNNSTNYFQLLSYKSVDMQLGNSNQPIKFYYV